VEPAVVEEIVARAVERAFEPGACVLMEDHAELSFFILLKGSVKVLYRSPEGLEVVVKLFRAPAVFGEMECLTRVPYLETVQTLERSLVLELPQAEFMEALRRSHALTFNVLGDLAARLCIAAQNERSLAFHPVETRLAQLLLTYVDFYGLPVEGGVRIRIPLSQDDLANALGVARRSVTRALKEWQEQDLIAKEGGCYVVRAPEKLEAITDPTLLRIGHRTGARLVRATKR
jgi:CRP/FNR family transcriptional regulator